MKKTLIAGAASFALAAMPVIGVFALTDPAALVDTLTVTVTESCTFGRATGGQATFEHTMLANALKDDFGSNTFETECNNGLGYTITGEFTSLTHSAGNGAAITYGSQAPTAGSGTWVADTTGGIIANNGNLANTSTQDPSGGSSYTVTYKVSTHTTQAAGTYSGTATWTLAQKTGS